MNEMFYSHYVSPLGLMQLACNDTCITAINFLDNDDTLQPDTVAAPAILQQCKDQLIEYFQGQRKNFELPVQQPGSDFQQRVWNELLSIPYGKTISYLAQAKRLGDPQAIRAVASTNGKNNIAVIVPCHRVIGTNRDLVGYASGIWRKKWLLEMEMKYTWGVQTLF